MDCSTIVVLIFGVCMCYFSNKKKDQIWNFHDLLGARQHSQKSSEKINLHL